jgi:hypothetical protein
MKLLLEVLTCGSICRHPCLDRTLRWVSADEAGLQSKALYTHDSVAEFSDSGTYLTPKEAARSDNCDG